MIAYHASGYPFYCADGGQRWSFYGLNSTPIVRIDGISQLTGGNTSPATMYPTHRRWLTQKLAVWSPLLIDLACQYDTVANTGNVTACVTSDTTVTVAGNIYFAVIENNIPYSWGGLTTVEHVCRDMLPNGTGEAVSIAAADSIIRARDFTITSGWNENNIYIVVWVQNTTTREIYQAGLVKVVPEPDMEYWGYTLTEESGNSNGVAEPGEVINLHINAKNNAGGSYTGGAAISTSDPYVTINSSNQQATAIGAGETDTVLIAECAISAACSLDHMAQFSIDFGAPGDTATARLIVTDHPGFCDDVESGQGGWTHSGYYDQWHITTYESHSPANSWYNGYENTHQYPNFATSQLISPYFVVTPDSSLTFWHSYATQTNWDCCYAEIDDNCGWWAILAPYTGSQTAWTQAAFPLTRYSGQTVRLRFRFISNQDGTNTGWFIDDVNVPVIYGIMESETALQPIMLQMMPNPFRNALNIKFQIPSTKSQTNSKFQFLNPKLRPTLKIYDAAGSLVRFIDLSALYSQLATYVTWKGTDDAGRPVPAGVYFVRFESDIGTITEKALLVR